MLSISSNLALSIALLVFEFSFSYQNSIAFKVNSTSQDHKISHIYESVMPNGDVYAVPFNPAYRNFRKGKAIRNVNSVVDINGIKSLGRVVGGSEVESGSLPYQVGFILESIGLYCGGSIYNTRIIITAAHCFYEDGEFVALDDIVIAAGKTNLSKKEKYEELRLILKVDIHPLFDKEAGTNDIALVTLKNPLCFNNFVQPIKIAERNTEPKGECVISGWGYTVARDPNDESNYDNSKYSFNLKSTKLTIITKENCMETFAKKGEEIYKKIADHPNTICAGADGDDACQGDSGGPLACKNGKGEEYLAGVISSGMGCGVANLPSFYSDISKYADWILQVGGKAGEPCHD